MFLSRVISEFHEVLRNNMKGSTLTGKQFQRTRGYFILRVPNLDGPQEGAGVDQQGILYTRSGYMLSRLMALSDRTGKPGS